MKSDVAEVGFVSKVPTLRTGRTISEMRKIVIAGYAERAEDMKRGAQG